VDYTNALFTAQFTAYIVCEIMWIVIIHTAHISLYISITYLVCELLWIIIMHTVHNTVQCIPELLRISQFTQI